MSWPRGGFDNLVWSSVSLVVVGAYVVSIGIGDVGECGYLEVQANEIYVCLLHRGVVLEGGRRHDALVMSAAKCCA